MTANARQPDRTTPAAVNKHYDEDSTTVTALKIARQKTELARLECAGAAMKIERRAHAHLEACDPKGADRLFREAVPISSKPASPATPSVATGC